METSCKTDEPKSTELIETIGFIHRDVDDGPGEMQQRHKCVKQLPWPREILLDAQCIDGEDKVKHEHNRPTKVNASKYNSVL